MATVTATAVQTAKNYIAGAWVAPDGKRTVERRNPANHDDVVGTVTMSTRDQARVAIEAARNALPAWRNTPPPVRGKILFKAWQLMTEQIDELAAILTREEGKTINESKGEILRSINVLEFMAGEGRRIIGETLPSELPKNLAYTLKQPLGVVAVITPWNFPICIPVWKIAPALITGNTVVFKPATITSFTGMALVKIFEQAGVPAGVLNMVVGSGGEVGDELIKHRDIKAISFTGSTEIGSKLYAEGAAGLKKVQCEMGGKNPIVVMEDADLDLAVASTVQGAFGSTGQRCTATSRAVVIDSIADEFVKRVKAAAEKLVVGDGSKPGVQMGPSVDQAQFNTVLEYLKIGKDEGAKLVLGGNKLTGGEYDKGMFVQPTIFDHVKTTMRLAQEEIFGPVLSVIRVKDYEEALRVANDCAYGLSSSIYTQDVSRFFDFAERVETGMTHVNSPTTGGEAHIPFGGMKGTGVGVREQGTVAIDFFTEIKAVYVDFTGKKRESNIY